MVVDIFLPDTLLGYLVNVLDQYMEFRREFVLPAVYLVHPITIVRGFNERLYDINGKEYIDFTSGIGVTILGHANPELIETAMEALRNLWHTCIHVANYPSYVLLARKLSVKIRLSEQGMVALFNSGAEAVENAVKIAKAATRKYYFVSFVGGFHGRTFMSLALTGKYKPYKVGFGPLTSGVVKVQYPYCYRMPVKDENECVDMVLSELESIVDIDLSPDVIAGIIVEPIQGEGGFVVPPRRFLREIEVFARKRSIVFVVDEVQTGYCRTGQFMAYEHYGVLPDIVVLGKAMANGLPLSGVVTAKSLAEKLAEGSIGGTFGGNPIAAAVALKVLDIIERDNLCRRAKELGKIMEERMEEMKSKYRFIGDHRGIGVMRALEFVKNEKTKEPAPNIAKRVLEEARRRGLLLLTAGYYGNVVRMHPPLTISEDSLEKGLDILDKSLAQVT